MKYEIKATNKFKKNFKLCIKRGCNRSLFDAVIEMLVSGKKLPEKQKAHRLHGKYKDFWECHITPDLLLV